MSRADARAILNAARDGRPVRSDLIRRALLATGDITARRPLPFVPIRRTT